MSKSRTARQAPPAKHAATPGPLTWALSAAGGREAYVARQGYQVVAEDGGWSAYCGSKWLGLYRLSLVAKGHCEEHRRAGR